MKYKLWALSKGITLYIHLTFFLLQKIVEIFNSLEKGRTMELTAKLEKFKINFSVLPSIPIEGKEAVKFDFELEKVDNKATMTVEEFQSELDHIVKINDNAINFITTTINKFGDKAFEQSAQSNMTRQFEVETRRMEIDSRNKELEVRELEAKDRILANEVRMAEFNAQFKS